MQIQGNFVPGRPHHLNTASRPQDGAPATTEEPAAAPVSTSVAPAEGSSTVSTLAPTGADSAQTVEEGFRAHLAQEQATDHRGRGVEGGRRNGMVHREINAMRRALRQELRSLARQMEGSGDAGDLAETGDGSQREEVLRLGREFDAALREAAHAQRPSTSTEPGALTDAARAAFDELHSALGALLAPPTEPVGEEPVVGPAFAVVATTSEEESAVEDTAELQPTAEPQPVTATDPTAEPEPATPTEVGAESAEALLAPLAARFESLLAILESSLSVFLEAAADAYASAATDDPAQPVGSGFDALG